MWADRHGFIHTKRHDNFGNIMVYPDFINHPGRTGEKSWQQRETEDYHPIPGDRDVSFQYAGAVRKGVKAATNIKRRWCCLRMEL
jgi:hypothetical protein